MVNKQKITFAFNFGKLQWMQVLEQSFKGVVIYVSVQVESLECVKCVSEIDLPWDRGVALE